MSAHELSLPSSAERPGTLSVPHGPLSVPHRALGAERPVQLSVIVPTFNEAKNITEMVARLTDLLEPVLGDDYELIVVDDDSADKTWAVAQALTASYPRLRVMRRVGERGLSTAVIRGWQAARGEVLAVIDADLQHPPELLLGLWEQMGQGADLVLGSRHVCGGGVSDWSLARRILSRGAQLLGLIVLPKVVGRVSDPMSGYFMVRRKCIADRLLSPLGYKILIEVLGRGDIGPVREVGYVFRERVEGESKVTLGLYLDFLRHLARLRFSSWPIARFARFCTVGFSGVFVDMTFLYLLTDPHMLGWGLTRGKIVAAEIAILNNFLWNDAWTFRDTAKDQREFHHKLRRFLKFNMVCLLGVAWSVLLLNFQFNLLHVPRYLANAISIVLVTLWNYWLNSRLSWRTAEINKTSPTPAALSSSTLPDTPLAKATRTRSAQLPPVA